MSVGTDLASCVSAASLGSAQEGLWPRLFSCPVPPSGHPWDPELGRRLVFIELIGGLLSRQRSGSTD